MTKQNPAVGRRARKKQETRERIFESGVALFTTRGYDATSMEDIGERADVSRATVFNYFARKDDIVFEWFDRRRTEFARVLGEREPREPGTAHQLRRAFLVLADLYKKDAATGRVMVRAWQRAGGPLAPDESNTPELLAESVRAGQRGGDVATDIDADRAGLVLFDAYLGVLCRWVLDETGTYDLGDQLMATLDLLLPGIVRTGSDTPP